MQNVKTVVCGDGAVGKTCLLISYTTNSFPGDYVPTIFDNYSCNLMVDGKAIHLALWDTAGQRDYDRLRPISYPYTDVFMLVYSVISPASYENMKSHWYPEISHHAPGVPIILVANKADLRGDAKLTKELAVQGKEMVSKESGAALAKEIGASAFFEVSALTQDGMKQMFESLVRIGLDKLGKGKKKAKKCIIL